MTLIVVNQFCETRLLNSFCQTLIKVKDAEKQAAPRIKAVPRPKLDEVKCQNIREPDPETRSMLLGLYHKRDLEKVRDRRQGPCS